MLTYSKTIKEPRLIIEHDEWIESPRTFDGGNVGLFLTKERNHKSPDGTDHPLYQIMVDAGDEAKDQAEHIKLIEEKAHAAFKASAPKDGCSHDENLHVVEVHPVYCYEHGNIVYKRGNASGFDYSACGFYIVTANSISGKIWTPETIAEAIDAELATYSQWANGEVYRFTLYDQDGEQEDACGGFYELETIREHLPEDRKDEELDQYLIV